MRKKSVDVGEGSLEESGHRLDQRRPSVVPGRPTLLANQLAGEHAYNEQDGPLPSSPGRHNGPEYLSSFGKTQCPQHELRLGKVVHESVSALDREPVSSRPGKSANSKGVVHVQDVVVDTKDGGPEAVLFGGDQALQAFVE